MLPVLLQQDPLRHLIENLESLIPLVIFIGAALLPVIKGARDRKRQQEAERRHEAGAPAAAAPAAAPAAADQRGKAARAETPPGPSQLEERVRRYFEELARQASGERAPVPAATRQQTPPPPPPAPPPVRQRLADLGSGIQHLDVKLDSLQVTRRKPLPSRDRRRRRLAGSARPGAKAPATRPLANLLHDRRSLREAIILREMLGPPRALDPHATRR